MTDTITIKHTVVIPLNTTAEEIKKALSNIPSDARISMMPDTMELIFEETPSKCEIELRHYNEIIIDMLTRGKLT